MVHKVTTIELWAADPEDWVDRSDELAERFSVYDGSSEPKAFEALKLPNRRHDFLVSRYLLAEALEHFGENPRWVSRDEQGKPYLIKPDAHVGGSVHFNLSYSEGFVLCGVTRSFPLGVDVESVRRQVTMEAVVERYFAPRERATFLAQDGEKRREIFYGFWTLKEAFLKGLGTGLRTSILSCVLDLCGEEQVALTLGEEVQADAAAWHLTLLAMGDHRVALACGAGRDAMVRIIGQRLLPGRVGVPLPLQILRYSNLEPNRCTLA